MQGKLIGLTCEFNVEFPCQPINLPTESLARVEGEYNIVQASFPDIFVFENMKRYEIN